MSRKTPIFLNDHQQEQLINALENAFDTTEVNIAHEITSEYIHSDALIMSKDGEDTTFASFGMCARKQNSHIDEPREHFIPDIDQ